MFFYSKGETFNVVVSLDDLETGVLLLSQPAAPLNRDYARWDEWASGIARAMTTGGMLHVTASPAAGEPPLHGWRGALADAPDPYRARTADALAFFALRGAVGTAAATVEVIGLDGRAESKSEKTHT